METFTIQRDMKESISYKAIYKNCSQFVYISYF